MEWDDLDEEIRRELDEISLNASEASSRSASPSPNKQPYPVQAELTDVSALFGGYLTMTGGAEDVDQVLSEVRDLLHTSPPPHLTKLGDDDLSDYSSSLNIADPVQLTSLEGHDPKTLEPTVTTSLISEEAGLEGYNSPTNVTTNPDLRDLEAQHYVVATIKEQDGDELLAVQQLLSEEQQKKELELNALIEENQRKYKERAQILNERKRTKAAIKLQAFFRGHHSRLQYKKVLHLKTKMATIIQASWRGHCARKRRIAKMRAILAIQHSWRKHKFKQKMLRAIVCIQSKWRAHRQAKRLRAATVLQRSWRRHSHCAKISIDKSSEHSSESQLEESLQSEKNGVEETITNTIVSLENIAPASAAPDVEAHSTCIQQSLPPNQVSSSYTQDESDEVPQTQEASLTQESRQTEVQAEEITQDPSSQPASTGNVSKDLDSEYLPKQQNPQSPSKLTISKRIQSALKLVQQSSSTHQLGRADSGLRETRSYSLPTTMRKTVSSMSWSQLKVDKNMLASVLTGRDRSLSTDKQDKEAGKQPTIGSTVPEQAGQVINVQQHGPKDTTMPNSISMVAASSAAQAPIQQNVSTPDEALKNLSPKQSSLVSPQLVPMSQQKVSMPVQQHPKSQKDLLSQSQTQTVESESLALQEMKERREKEMAVAEQSRERMSNLLSEEEIQKVAKEKRAHDTYNSELDFAAQPLSSRAWCGVIAERLEQWKKHHKSWVAPTPHTHTSQPPHPHLPHTGTPLTSAQMIAASPKDTPLDQVAMVIMYRSRKPVDLSSLSKCPRLATVSLTKCGLSSLSRLEGCSQLREVKVQSNSIEHIDIQGLSELSFADISDNRLASIHGIQSCNKLLTLDLSENRLARLVGLEGCHQLQKLSVDSNLIINSKGLSSVPRLQWFSCSENHLPKVEGLDMCSLLQHLNLAQNNLQQPPALCAHVLLRELHLDGNSLADVSPLSKAWLPLLQNLTLANNCITELASLTCMVMLESLDVSNNSLYDLPVFLQCIRGCYQLQQLVVNGNPVAEEPKLRYYITKALPCLEALDEKSVKPKAQVPKVVSSSSVYILCKRQLSEQDTSRQTSEQLEGSRLEGGEGPPSPDSVVKALNDKVSHCQDYQAMLVRHLREHECLDMRDGPPPAPSPQNKVLQQTKAAVKIQATWRGFKGRQWVEHLRHTYNRAATIIQATFRGCILRAKLRLLLKNARYMDEGCVACDGVGGEGVESEESVDFEKEITVDYLDESALDNELAPLSPREPLPKRYIAPTSPPSFRERPRLKSPPTEKPTLPVYSLPGCAEEEVELEEWKKQQKIPNRFKPASEAVRREVFGVPVVSEGVEAVRGNPLAAWGSTTDMDEEGLRSDKHSDKVDIIVNEWGLQSSSTAELMMKRAERQKKLRTKAARKKKLADPAQRLAAFRRKAPPTHILRAQQDLYRDQSPVASAVSPQPSQKDFVYQWVNNHTVVHERDSGYKTSQRGSSILPPMEPRILAGHAPQLVQSSNTSLYGQQTMSQHTLKEH